MCEKEEDSELKHLLNYYINVHYIEALQIHTKIGFIYLYFQPDWIVHIQLLQYAIDRFLTPLKKRETVMLTV